MTDSRKRMLRVCKHIYAPPTINISIIHLNNVFVNNELEPKGLDVRHNGIQDRQPTVIGSANNDLSKAKAYSTWSKGARIPREGSHPHHPTWVACIYVRS